MNKESLALIDKILIAVGVVCLFFIILLGSFSVMVYYKGFYYSEYSKNNVYEKLSSNLSESKLLATSITDNLISYFRGKESLDYFTPIEQSHLRDVKFLFSAINFIYYSAALFFIVVFVILYVRHKKEIIKFIDILSKLIFIGSLISLTLLLSLFLMTLFNFDVSFIALHMVLFPQGNWMFSNSSLLITLFPESFFFDMGLRIFVYAIFQASVFLIIGLWLRKQVKIYSRWGK